LAGAVEFAAFLGLNFHSPAIAQVAAPKISKEGWPQTTLKQSGCNSRLAVPRSLVSAGVAGQYAIFCTISLQTQRNLPILSCHTSPKPRSGLLSTVHHDNDPIFLWRPSGCSSMC
jgi:hypothetical protein